jgi:uncharacterized coiled-coil protein SlyX
MEDDILKKIQDNCSLMLDRLRTAEPEDAVRLSAAIKNLAVSIAELRAADQRQPAGLAALLKNLNNVDPQHSS